MNCFRCDGLMVEDHFLDFEGTTGHMWASGFRCMNCGNVLDPVIERHQSARPEPVRVLLCAEPDYQDHAARLESALLTARAA